MRVRALRQVAGVALLALIACGSSQAPQQPPGKSIGRWSPPRGLVQQPLWPGTAPDQAAAGRPPEHSETGVNPKRFAGLPVTGVYDVSTPTLTVFPATAEPNGAAVVVFPGGGFKQLAIDLEGSEACDWLNALSLIHI